MIGFIKKYILQNFWLALLFFSMDYYSLVMHTPGTYYGRFLAAVVCAIEAFWLCYSFEKKFVPKGKR